MSLVFVILAVAGVAAVLCLMTGRDRLVYIIPLLLAFECRVRLGAVSFDLSELTVVFAMSVWLLDPGDEKRLDVANRVSTNGVLIALLGVFALPSVFLEDHFLHSVSTYRDLMVPFVFLFCFLKAGIDLPQLRKLVVAACCLILFNAILGIIQFKTGNYLWFANEDEMDWQVYKIGLVKISLLGEFLGIKDALPAGLYSGTNNFGLYLTIPLCICGTVVLSRNFARRERVFCLLASATLFVCLVLTIFRSGLLVYFTSILAIYLFVTPRFRQVRLIAVLLIAATFAVFFLSQGVFDFDSFGTFSARQGMLSDAWTLIKSHPEVLLAGGFTDLYHQQFRQEQEIHNLMLYAIVKYGLLATLCFYCIVGFALWRAVRAVKTSVGPERDILLSLTVSLSANVFLCGLSTMIIDSVQTTIWLLFWLGITIHLTTWLDFQKAEAMETRSIPLASWDHAVSYGN